MSLTGDDGVALALDCAGLWALVPALGAGEFPAAGSALWGVTTAVDNCGEAAGTGGSALGSDTDRDSAAWRTGLPTDALGSGTFGPGRSFSKAAL